MKSLQMGKKRAWTTRMPMEDVRFKINMLSMTGSVDREQAYIMLPFLRVNGYARISESSFID
jgi:hypothetical protein